MQNDDDAASLTGANEPPAHISGHALENRPAAAPDDVRYDDTLESRLRAVGMVARYHGTELERSDLRLMATAPLPSPADLVKWVRGAGLWARADHLRWSHLMKVQSDQPIVLLFTDGSAAVLTGRSRERNVVFLTDPRGSMTDAPTAVDELRLNQLWAGEAIMVRPERADSPEDEPFDFGWIFRLVLTEKSILREIAIGSIGLAILGLVPVLIVMMVVDKVLAHQALNTLIFAALLLGVIWIFEAILTYARHNLAATLSARLATRLNLHMFSRLLSLPLDYFETNPAGQTSYRLAQINRVREFITGTFMDTLLDFFMLIVIMPLLFYLAGNLTWFILGFSLVIAIIIFCFLKPMRKLFGRVVVAEVEKSTVMVETVHGIRTVKSLALEPQQKDAWDHKVANAARLRLKADHLAAWPAALTLPFQRLAERGALLLGAYIALYNPTAVTTGTLFAIMILGGKVSGPLVSAVKMMQQMEEIRSSVHQISLVLNNPTEVSSRATGMRPKFTGAISFDGLTFTYAGTKTPALNKITCEIPAGTMLGLVGRSGSGKSTVTRMLQGISRNYEGYLKLDGIELREIQLSHLRRSFGTVLQENFLFRGSIRENIIAGRPGLTMDDVIRASRMAGAEEFVERMPKGYETFIEEGSPNLSGGQRQRLAIARAVICDPKLMILDEATSALDTRTELGIQAALRALSRDRTTLIIAHRLSTVVDADQILVLEDGQVCEAGTHANLIARNGLYAAMWARQEQDYALEDAD